MKTISLSSSRADGLRDLIGDADRLLKSLARSGDEKLDAVREGLSEQVYQVRSQLVSLQDDALHRARQAARQADRAVHEHPYHAIGVGLAAGLLVGILLSRR